MEQKCEKYGSKWNKIVKKYGSKWTKNGPKMDPKDHKRICNSFEMDKNRLKSTKNEKKKTRSNIAPKST